MFSRTVLTYCSMVVLQHAFARPPRDIEVLVTLQYDVPGFVTNAVYMNPAMQVWREEFNKRHGGRYNVSVRFFQHKDHRTCDDVTADAVADISEYLIRESRPDTCYGIIESACNEQNGLSSLAAELDVLAITLNMDAMNKDFLTPRSHPQTTISMGPSSASFSMAVLTVLRYYKWYHVTVLVEVTSTLSGLYSTMAAALLEMAKPSDDDDVTYEMVAQYVKSSISNDDLKGVLHVSKRRSRVFVLFSTGVFVLRILAMTDELHMSNGEYVFINCQPVKTLSYGIPAQFTRSVNDTSNLNAFRSLIFLLSATKEATAKTLADVNSRIARVTKDKYNFTYPNGDPALDSGFGARSAMDMSEMVALLVVDRDTSDPHLAEQRCSGRDLAARVSNRSFTQTTGKSYFSSGGIRLYNTDVFAFNTSTLSLQPIGLYNCTQQQLRLRPGMGIPWPTADGLAPRDKPKCGFIGDEGTCAAERITTIIRALSAVTACGAVLAGTSILRRWHVLNDTLPVHRWRLDEGCLHYLENRFSVAHLPYRDSWNAYDYPRKPSFPRPRPLECV